MEGKERKKEGRKGRREGLRGGLVSQWGFRGGGERKEISLSFSLIHTHTHIHMYDKHTTHYTHKSRTA